MKNIVKAIMICVAFSTVACNNDDNNNETVEQNLVFENNNAIVIPDATGGWLDPNVPAIISSAISVDAKGRIVKPWKVNISLELNYFHASYTDFELFAPSGESCKLINQLYCRYIAGNIVTFNSGAISPIQQYSFPVATGSYLPSTGLQNVQADNLGAFLEGKDIDGVWTLKITDRVNDEIDTDPNDEKLVSWKLEFDRDALE